MKPPLTYRPKSTSPNIGRKWHFFIFFIFILFVSCNSNVFVFDEKKQEIIATNFSYLEIQVLNSDEAYILKRLPDKKIKAVKLARIHDYFQIINATGFDTLQQLTFKNSSKYQIKNRGVYDAAVYGIVLETDSTGVFHEVIN